MGAAKAGIISTLEYFTIVQQSQHLELGQEIILGLYHLNFLFCFAKHPKFLLIYRNTATAPSVAEAEHPRKIPFHQVCYNCDRYPG